MKMEMIQQLLIPGMQNAQKADLAAEAVSGVAAELAQGLRHAVEQDLKNRRLVAQDEWVELVGQCEDDMKVSDG